MKLPVSHPQADPIATRIVSAARGHFLQHGFRSVTMDDLASAMGMSKKTLYVHFSNKRDLLDAVISEKTADFEAAMDAVESGEPGDFGATLHRLLDCMQRNTREISASFLRDLSKGDPAHFQKIKTKRHEVIGRTFVRILRVGQKAGAIRSDIPADLLVEILLGITDSVATPENLAAKGIAPGELLADILKVFLHGILTHPRIS